MSNTQPDLPTAVPELTIAQEGFEAPSPQLLLLNDALATDLGFNPEWLRSEEGLRFLTGHGTGTKESLPVATGYAGHQFGNFAGVLGDGRALLLATAEGRPGLTGLPGLPRLAGLAGQDQPGRATQLYEVQAKGTGPTPFSRGGDGKATLTSALREYLISEAMFAQGIPTTRALAVIATGEQIHRGPQVPFDEQPPTSELQPGGIVVRVATSHLRVGTFELIARSGPDVMPRAISFAADRHLYDATARGVLQGVVTRQADLVAQWMTSGFVHGVMNTDNTTISGETIDYGPCAFLDAHDPRAVFSSIDRAGRYAFGAQPTIAGWNLTRLAEALLPSIADEIAATDTAATDAAADTSPNTPDAPNAALDVAREILGGFADEFATALARHWLPKLGLPASLYDDPVATDLLRRWQSLLAQFGPDHTNAHLALGNALDSENADALVASRATLDASEQWAEAAAGWVADWAAVREKLGIAPEESAALMEASNPAYVPRNHLVTETLAQAAEGNLDDYRQLLEAVTHPYEGRAHSDDDQTPRPEKFTLPAPAGLGAFRSYCGT